MNYAMEIFVGKPPNQKRELAQTSEGKVYVFPNKWSAQNSLCNGRPIKTDLPANMPDYETERKEKVKAYNKYLMENY